MSVSDQGDGYPPSICRGYRRFYRSIRRVAGVGGTARPGIVKHIVARIAAR